MAITRIAAEKVLIQVLGDAVRLGEAEAIGGGNRSHVHRFPLLDVPPHAPQSVVVKTAPRFGDESYDPGSTHFASSASRLFRDWAGLRFLAAVSGREPLAPRLYGGDREVGLIVIEDLGTQERTPDRLLLRNDYADAERSLVEIARALGRMHARSVGQEPLFETIQSELGRLVRPEAEHVRLQKYFHSWADAVDSAVPPRVEPELDALIAALRDPGPFLAYTHGDPCPDNWVRSGSRLYLIDFERGTFRHALLDGVYGRIHFPTCWCVNRLPAHLPLLMEEAYRSELIEGCPEAADDELFNHAVVDACAYHVISFPGEYLPSVLREDQTWGISTVRQRVLVRFDIFARLTQEFGHLEAVGETVGKMAAKLRGIWPAEADEMPLYPAFRGAESG